jgi:hypothetical protein
MASSEPNTILEINEAHADNYILVIPNLPTAAFIGSAFAEATRPTVFVSTTPSTSGSECGDGPEFDPTNPGLSTGTSGTTGTSGSPCNQTEAQRQSKIMRELNLDLRNFMLYIQDVDLPSVNIDKVTLGTMFADVSRASKIHFSDLNTKMVVSENLLNYNIMLYWMYALHNPEEFNNMSGRGMIDTFFQDIHLIITNNHREKIMEYKFIDAFPISLSPLNFTHRTADELSMSVGWAHSGMVPANNYVLRFV